MEEIANKFGDKVEVSFAAALHEQDGDEEKLPGIEIKRPIQDIHAQAVLAE